MVVSKKAICPQPLLEILLERVLDLHSDIIHVTVTLQITLRSLIQGGGMIIASKRDDKHTSLKAIGRRIHGVGV
jgi:hypothetical protein